MSKMYQLFDNYHILFPSCSIIFHSFWTHFLLDVALCPGDPQPAQSLSPRLAKSVAAGLAAGLAAHLAGGGATSGDDWENG